MTPSQYQDQIDREIVLTRVFAAPKEVVFKAFSDQSALDEWFGPNGFTSTTLEFNFKVGGRWRFDFKGPDGTVYDNRVEYVEITPFNRLAFHHGADKDNDPNRFYVTITLDEQQDKKTVLTLRQLHPSKQRRDVGIGFGAVEFGLQTLDKLAKFLDKRNNHGQS
jgi:uncharacterized protein YndB with AHSA1/START domain